MARGECVVEQKGEKAGGCAQGAQVWVGDQTQGKVSSEAV